MKRLSYRMGQLVGFFVIAIVVVLLACGMAASVWLVWETLPLVMSVGIFIVIAFFAGVCLGAGWTQREQEKEKHEQPAKQLDNLPRPQRPRVH